MNPFMTPESFEQYIMREIEKQKEQRRERIATAIMAGIYANPARADISEKMAALCAIDGMEALIKALDEVKE